jgi:bacterioferritin-associated ferredoxin
VTVFKGSAALAADGAGNRELVLKFIFNTLPFDPLVGGSTMIVCHCKSVSDRAIRAAVRNGARTRNDVVKACAAGTCCGGCAPAVDEIIEAETERAHTRSVGAFRKLAVVS